MKRLRKLVTFDGDLGGLSWGERTWQTSIPLKNHWKIDFNGVHSLPGCFLKQLDGGPRRPGYRLFGKFGELTTLQSFIVVEFLGFGFLGRLTS